MGKTVAMVVGIVAAIAISIAAPYLAGLAITALSITSTAVATALAVGLTAVIGIGLTLGVQMVMRSLGVGSVPSAKATSTPQVFRQSITDSFIVYGKRRCGGLLVFFHPKQVGSDHFRYFVIAVAGHQCKGLVSFMLNDEVVTIDGSGMVTSGKYANAAWLWFVRGTNADAANATFVSECDGKWTTAHQGLGIAKIYAKFKMTDAVVQAGMPNMTAIIEGKDTIRDPRGPSTGYTRNGPLIFYDWMQTPREEGGFGAYSDEIPADDWISAQANVADEGVNGNPRYQVDAYLTTGSPPSEVRDAMVVNMAGKYTYSGGKHLMRPGYWVPPDQTLREDDLAGPIQVSPFLPPDAAANQIQGTYVSPTDGYQGMPFTTQSAPSSDVKQMDLDLAFTTVLDQANRVATIMLKRAQAEKSVVWPMNCVGIGVRTLDTVQVDKVEYGLNNYAWSVVSWGLSPDYNVLLRLQEENAEIYDDPAPVTPPARPAIAVGSTVLTTAQAAQIISISKVINPDISTEVLTATESQIIIKDHYRAYSDKTVLVSGTAPALQAETGTPLQTESGAFLQAESGPSALTGLAASTLYHIGYSDLPRVGGAVTYLVSQNLSDVSNPGTGNPAVGSTDPGMHYLGSVTTAAAGSGSTTSGSAALPPGYAGGPALP